MNTSSVRFSRAAGLFILLGLLASACSPVVEPAPGDLQGKQATQETPLQETQADMGTTPGRETPPVSTVLPGREIQPLPERVPTDPGLPASPVTGETPGELLEAIKSDLASRTGASSGEIRVLRDQAMVFNDGSLGCPQPGMFYTQATVAGYWVVLELGQVEYDYRATENGSFILCESGLPPGLTPPGDLPPPAILPEQ